MSEAALDASAVLALLQEEPGSEEITPLLAAPVIGAANVAEVVSKRAGAGMPPAQGGAAVEALGVAVVPFDLALAGETGALRPVTAAAGPSLGDRACLALAKRLGRETVTTDAAWAGLRRGVLCRVVRAGRRGG